ncbi:hypothetical protein [Paraburkholderia sediminicola]|uniref:hypothetical protein n=1 Tax=Paraburkholderia sediminicola TaxID=458836 RepID=UPI0038B6BDEC
MKSDNSEKSDCIEVGHAVHARTLLTRSISGFRNLAGATVELDALGGIVDPRELAMGVGEDA